MEEAATNTLPKKVYSKEANLWDEDPELSLLRNLRDMTDRQTQADEFKNITKKIRKRFDQLRNIHYEGQAEKLNDAYEARNLEKLFRLCKESSSHKRPVEQPCPGLREHFQAHFTHQGPSEEPPPEISNPPEFIKRLTESGIANDQHLDQIRRLGIKIPDRTEITKIIRKLKSRKAATDIPPEFLKAASESEAFSDALVSVYKKTWELILPDMWRMTTITALYKNKGKRKECKNYRGLSIGSTFLKLAMAIIIERIRPWYNKQLLLNQNGFREHFGCPDAIFSLKSIQNIATKLNKEVPVLFIDLTAAYDWCVRKWIFHTIFNRINPEDKELINCVKIIEELYKKTESTMKGEKEYFETTSGVRQGGSESPNLFNLFLDYIMRIYNDHATKLGLGVSFKFRIKDQARDRSDTEAYRGEMSYPWIGYADDLALMADSIELLQRAADVLQDLLSRFGLVISIDKTKTMIFNWKGDESQYPETIITINNIAIENVKQFVYLGSSISYSEPGTSDKELDRRIGMAHSKFAEMKKVLCNYHLKLHIRMKYYNTYIRMRLCYCCETWTLTQKQYQRIEKVHLQFLRRLVRGGMARKSSRDEIEKAKEALKQGVDGEQTEINWAWKHTNENILNMCHTETIQQYIEKQNIRWVAHVVRSSNACLTKRLMFEDEKHTKVGRHHKTVYETVIKSQEDQGVSAETFLKNCIKRKIVG